MWKHQKAVERLEDRCRALEHNVEDLDRANKKLGLEWEELYDKVRHQMSRMSKRVPVEPPAGSNGPDLEIPAGDDPEVDPISAGILRRRNPGAFHR